jgi:hypothetical protein
MAAIIVFGSKGPSTLRRRRSRANDAREIVREITRVEA